MQQLGTYQTRISDYGGVNRSAGDAALAACAALYGRVQRKLFADVAAGSSASSLKGAYLKRYGIPARMFNAVRVSLEGKVASVRETMALRRESLQRRISRAEREITKAGKQKGHFGNGTIHLRSLPLTSFLIVEFSAYCGKYIIALYKPIFTYSVLLTSFACVTVTRVESTMRPIEIWHKLAKNKFRE